MVPSAAGPGRASPASLRAALRVFSSHASPRILLALVAGLIAARVAAGAWSAWDAAIVLAIAAFWPVQEWLIHVFILHYRPVRLFGRSWDFRTPRLHRAHHRDPWDEGLVFIPVHVFAYAPLVLGVLGWAIAPAWPQALTGLALYFALSLHYEWVNFLVHTRYRPRTRLYLRLWRNHRLHHFKNEHYWYGVSMLGGDRLLGTRAEPGSVATSPTCRSLGFEDSLGATP